MAKRRLASATPAAHSGEAMTFKLRYKNPESQTSKLMTLAVADDPGRFEQAGDDMKFAAAVASFGMILRGSPYKGSFQLADVHRLARAALGADGHGYRAEFLRLVTAAEAVLPD